MKIIGHNGIDRDNEIRSTFFLSIVLSVSNCWRFCLSSLASKCWRCDFLWCACTHTQLVFLLVQHCQDLGRFTMKWSEVRQSGGRGGGGDVYTVHFILHYSDDCQYSGIYSATSQDTQQHREKNRRALWHTGVMQLWHIQGSISVTGCVCIVMQQLIQCIRSRK